MLKGNISDHYTKGFAIQLGAGRYQDKVVASSKQLPLDAEIPRLELSVS
jgi:hypothetical protein